MISRRSTEGMSFVLAVVSLICSSLWLCYGMMCVNAFIYVPNLFGVCFSAAQVGYDDAPPCACSIALCTLEYLAEMLACVLYCTNLFLGFHRLHRRPFCLFVIFLSSFRCQCFLFWLFPTRKSTASSAGGTSSHKHLQERTDPHKGAV